MAHEVQVAIRLSGKLVEEAERLLKLMKKSAAYRSHSLSRAVVLRLALDRGLQVLRAELEQERPSK